MGVRRDSDADPIDELAAEPAGHERQRDRDDVENERADGRDRTRRY